MSTQMTSYRHDDNSQTWLLVLRDGTGAQKIHAREQLSLIFERRGMLEEASELLQANYTAGSHSLPLFRSLLRLYVKREYEEGAQWAMQQAFLMVQPSIETRPRVGPLRHGACDECGGPLGMRDKFAGRRTCKACIEWHDQSWKARCSAYEQYLDAVVSRDDEPLGLAYELTQLQTFLGVPEAPATELHRRAFAAYVERALADDRLTDEEEERLFYLMNAFGLKDDVLEDIPEWSMRYLVARANGGRLAPIDDCQLILRPGEIPYIEFVMSLMKERTVKEWQSGSAGFSFRIAKGVRFSTSQTRGRSVVVGTYMAMEDQGLLTVTSSRVVFAGSKRTYEYPYAKLMSLEVFSNAVRLHVSNRTTSQLFSGGEGVGNLLAATINAAIQSGR